MNYSFGFTFNVPPGLRAYWNSARYVAIGSECTCMQDHGRIIPLSRTEKTPDHQIELRAGYFDPDDLESSGVRPDGPERFVGPALKNSIKAVSNEPALVNGKEARRIVVEYTDPSHVPMRQETYDVIRKGIEYQIYLRAPVPLFKADAARFQAIVRSVSFRKRIP